MEVMFTILGSIVAGLIVNWAWKQIAENQELHHSTDSIQVIPTKEGEYNFQRLTIKNKGRKTLTEILIELDEKSIKNCHIQINHPESNYKQEINKEIHQITLKRLLASEKTELVFTALKEEFEGILIKNIKSNEVSSKEVKDTEKSTSAETDFASNVASVVVAVLVAIWFFYGRNTESQKSEIKGSEREESIKKEIVFDELINKSIGLEVKFDKNYYRLNEKLSFAIEVKNLNKKESIYNLRFSIRPKGYQLTYGEHAFELSRLVSGDTQKISRTIENKFPTGENFLEVIVSYETKSQSGIISALKEVQILKE